MNRRLSHSAKIIVALCLSAGLLAISPGAAQAGGMGCTPDGRPYVWISDATPGAVFTVYANGQNVGNVTIGADGAGSLAFGQPGVDYAVEVESLGHRSPATTINCPPPAGGGQGDTGQTAPQLACIEVKPASASQSRDSSLLVTQGGASIQGPAVILGTATN